MKAKNGIYNIAFSIFGQIITIIFGLVIPRLFTIHYGSAINGLFSTINQVFACLSLLEAGIGVTTIQALYKPIANNEKNAVNSILSATNKYYKRVALVYLITLLVLSSSFYFIFSKDSSQLQYWVVFGVVFFTGIGNVVNFTIQEKFKLLLEAEGKKYITINILTFIYILTSASKIICILLSFNIVVIQVCYFLINFIQVVLIYLYIKRKYTWVDLKMEPDYQAISQKNSVLVHQVSAFIFSNTDILILSIFRGLETASIYAMYKLPVSMIATLLANASSGCNFILGQTYSSDKAKYSTIIDVYDTFIQTLGFALFTVTYIFLIPFMKLYSNGFDINYIDSYLPALFIAIELLIVVRNASLNTINVAGHFKKTQWRALIESAINLIASLICVNRFGIYGVLIGTIIALTYRDNDIILYANRVILQRKPVKPYFIAVGNTGFMIAVIFLSAKIHIPVSDYLQLFISAAVTCLIVIPAFLLFNAVLHRRQFLYLWDIGRSALRKRRKQM